MMAIMLSVSPEFKMLQEGLAQMQNNVYRAYILKVGSIFLREIEGRFTTWSLSTRSLIVPMIILLKAI